MLKWIEGALFTRVDLSTSLWKLGLHRKHSSRIYGMISGAAYLFAKGIYQLLFTMLSYHGRVVVRANSMFGILLRKYHCPHPIKVRNPTLANHIIIATPKLCWRRFRVTSVFKESESSGTLIFSPKQPHSILQGRTFPKVCSTPLITSSAMPLPLRSPTSGLWPVMHGLSARPPLFHPTRS